MVDQKLQDLYTKGIEAFRRGEIHNAIDLLTQTIETDDQDHRAWNALGVALVKAGKYEDAGICFENAVTLDPLNEVYQRNLDKNSLHLHKNINTRLAKQIFPAVRSMNPIYLFGGIVGIILLVLVIFSIILPAMNPLPLSESAGEVPVSIELQGDIIFIQNSGGEGTKSVRFFQVTADNRTILSPDGRIRVLEPSAGSSLAIPVKEIRNSSPGDTITIQAVAMFTDGSSRQAALRTLTLPPLEKAEEEKPALPPYTPRYEPGDVLLLNTTGSYVLVTARVPEQEYRIQELDRRNDGLFQAARQEQDNISMAMTDANATKAAVLRLPESGLLQPGVPYQARSDSVQPGRISYPLYEQGDIVARTDNAGEDTLVILGYDTGTDEYATDTITRYYSGEWGYRPDITAEWLARDELERTYPSRINRIALSDIGIGADSSPPGKPALYSEGDIIAKDRGADSKQIIILAYLPETGEYRVDRIEASYSGVWHRDGNNESVIRSKLEREYPYKVRNVDLSLVKTG